MKDKGLDHGWYSNSDSKLQYWARKKLPLEAGTNSPEGTQLCDEAQGF